MREVNDKEMRQRFRVWQALVDSSYYFALAGLKAQGFNDQQAHQRLRARWKRSLAEHHRTNRKIARTIMRELGVQRSSN